MVDVTLNEEDLTELFPEDSLFSEYGEFSIEDFSASNFLSFVTLTIEKRTSRQIGMY
jgi:hypothetical protein